MSTNKTKEANNSTLNIIEYSNDGKIRVKGFEQHKFLQIKESVNDYFYFVPISVIDTLEKDEYIELSQTDFVEHPLAKKMLQNGLPNKTEYFLNNNDNRYYPSILN